MADGEIAPTNLRSRLEAIGIDLNDGAASGYLALGSPLNLNAIAIGLGLENIAYEPAEFTGLIYHREDPDATVVLFDNGVLTTVDAPTEEAVADVIVSAVERLTELGLAEPAEKSAVNLDDESIPIEDQLDRED